jgi:hypothetical protein
MGVPRTIKLKVERSADRLEGGTFQPVLRVHCDECSETASININKRAIDLPDEMIVKKFHQQGWVLDRRHALCPIHSGKPRRSADDVPIRTSPPVDYIAPAYEIDRWVNRGQTFGAADPPPFETERFPIESFNFTKEPTVAETARLSDLADIRKPDRETKRKIVDAIGGVWDDSRGRYLANNSDELIARDLKVPRAWVEDLRQELFGDNGGNLEMDEFAHDLDKHIKAVEKLTENALKLASDYEKIAGDMKALRTRLSRIETQVLPRR